MSYILTLLNTVSRRMRYTYDKTYWFINTPLSTFTINKITSHRNSLPPSRCLMICLCCCLFVCFDLFPSQPPSVRSWDDALHDSNGCARFSSLLMHVDVGLTEDIRNPPFNSAVAGVREVGLVFSSAVTVVDFFIETLGCVTSTERVPGCYGPTKMLGVGLRGAWAGENVVMWIIILLL